jgi:hypothetical protein
MVTNQQRVDAILLDIGITGDVKEKVRAYLVKLITECALFDREIYAAAEAFLAGFEVKAAKVK